MGASSGKIEKGARMKDEQSPGSFLSTQCCVVGGGPAGMMAGFLLARVGVDVAVLEKHEDFFRDFRGDTIHPSTLELFGELGLLDDFLKLPHMEARELDGFLGEEKVTVADFSRLPTRCKFIAFMPQWDFLNFVAERGGRLPAFRLLLGAEATDLIIEDGVVKGVSARTKDGSLQIGAALTIGADGRHSLMRDKAGFTPRNLGAPMDVLWFRISRRRDDPDNPAGRFEPGRFLVAINRSDYWQCGYLIPKGGFDAVKHKGLSDFRADLAKLAPFLADRVAELRDWEQIRLLTVAVDRLPQWSRPGLLCIGDAAHAMSPIGGVGVNLAVQDAVAAANILGDALRRGAPAAKLLQSVQRRREFPVKATQAVQLFIQNRFITGVLAGASPKRLPTPLVLLRKFPFLQRLAARFIGLGLRPEHVRVA